MALRILGPYGFAYMKKIITGFLGSFDKVTEINRSVAADYVGDFALKTILMSLPVGAIAALITLAFTLAQTRLLFSFELLKPKMSRLNPASGFKRMFSLKAVVSLLTSTVKIVMIGLILYTQIKSNIVSVVTLGNYGIGQAFMMVLKSVYDIAVRIGIFMTALSVLDYVYQWWDYERQLRMTKQEVKDEYKQIEGDPLLKGKIREQQRKISSSRMMQQVPLADVVVRNPTHFAVALKYDAQKDKAPVVVAKGKGYVALKIVEIAEQNGVEITENRPLARGLYEAVEVDQVIPEEFYKAVADVLAYIYKHRKRGFGYEKNI